jgi:hypothetical protein
MATRASKPENEKLDITPHGQSPYGTAAQAVHARQAVGCAVSARTALEQSSVATHVRVCEVSEHEAELLDTGDDYGRVIAFARASGLRLEECLLKWSEVQWDARQIVKRGKGDRLVIVSITAEIQDILLPLRAHDPVHVFTYVFDHGVRGRVKGKRYPITVTGMQTYWKRLRQRTGSPAYDFMIYDTTSGRNCCA